MVGTRDDEGDEGDLGAVFVAPGNDGELDSAPKILLLILCRTMQLRIQHEQRRS